MDYDGFFPTGNYMFKVNNRNRRRRYGQDFSAIKLVSVIFQTFFDKSINFGSLPTALRKVMTSKFVDFDEYQLAKYNKDKKKPRKKIKKPKDPKDKKKSNADTKDTEDSDLGESSQDEVKYENVFSIPRSLFGE